MEKEREERKECNHICTSNCRRKGCNCECGEWHEEPEIKCDICDDTGENPNYVYLEDAHEWVLDGTRPCICVINKKQSNEEHL